MCTAFCNNPHECCHTLTSSQSCRKQFLIENLQGTKVMSRKKGFTATTCVSGVAIGQQTKRFEALPESAKVSWPCQQHVLNGFSLRQDKLSCTSCSLYAGLALCLYVYLNHLPRWVLVHPWVPCSQFNCWSAVRCSRQPIVQQDDWIRSGADMQCILCPSLYSCSERVC